MGQHAYKKKTFDTPVRATVTIVRVPSIKIPVFLAQHRPERDRYRILNNHPFILE